MSGEEGNIWKRARKNNPRYVSPDVQGCGQEKEVYTIRKLRHDVILLTLSMSLPSGNPIKCHEEVFSLQPMILRKRFDIFPLSGGCSEGVDGFRLLFILRLGTDSGTGVRAVYNTVPQ